MLQHLNLNGEALELMFHDHFLDNMSNVIYIIVIFAAQDFFLSQEIQLIITIMFYNWKNCRGTCQ